MQCWPANANVLGKAAHRTHLFMLVSADGVECGLNIERNCYLS